MTLFIIKKFIKFIVCAAPELLKVIIFTTLILLLIFVGEFI